MTLVHPNLAPGLRAGKRTQQRRAEIRQHIKDGAFGFDDLEWHTALNEPAVGTVPVHTFVGWIPRIGQGQAIRADGVINRIMKDAGVARTRTCRELTDRQRRALVNELRLYCARVGWRKA